MQIRKSVAGKVVPSYALRPHFVTRLGDTEKRAHYPLLEVVSEHGKRYMLRTANKGLAKLYRQVFDSGNKSLMPLESRKINGAIMLGAIGSDDKFQPVFKVGRLFGVTKTYIENVAENLKGRRKLSTLNTAIGQVCADLKITKHQLFSEDPKESPFLEYEEDGYGARWPQCAKYIHAAYTERRNELTK